MNPTMTSGVTYDPYDAEIYADPYPIYQRLRDEAPLYWNDQHEFYALSRFEDVERALSDWESFVSSRGVILEMIKANITIPPGSVILEDPPSHTAHRGLLSRVFTPSRVKALEPQIRELCDSTLDPFMGAGRFDFISDFAERLPMRVIGMLLGIPVEDQEAMRLRAEDIVRTKAGEPLTTSPTDIMLGEFFADYVDWRYEHPADDVMSQLVQAEFEDETGTVRRLTRSEVLTYVNVLAAAGSETTTRLIGWIGKVLADHPDQRRELVADPSLIPKAVDETLRFESVAHNIGRCTTRDVEVSGGTILAGSPVLLLPASGNRDPRQFDGADRFDIHRTASRHLGFGYGIHFCLGASLARLEARIAVEELLVRFPEWEVVAEEASLAPSSVNRGWDTLPVVVSN